MFLLQVDNIPPSVSRSGKPIDLFPSGPISSIGHNAPTLASIVHRGVRLRKVTTRRTHTSPTVAAPTLARAFKAICQIFIFYADYLYIGFIYTYKPLFVIAANQCIGKGHTSRCRCHPVQPAKEEGCQEHQGRNETPKSGNSPSSSGISNPSGVFSFFSRSPDTASAISPTNAGCTTDGRIPAGRASNRKYISRCG